MDSYTKAVLTVIAVALSAIAVHMWAPKEAIAAPFGLSATTLGDLMDITKIKDPREREEAGLKARRGVLVIYVQGGSINTN